MTDYENLANKLKVMGHPVRLQILDMLRQGETCVCHIERALDKRQAYISQQLMILREAGLVDARKEGLQVYYRLIDRDILPLLDRLCGRVPDAFIRIDDCTCPLCTTIAVHQIQ